MYLLLKEGVIVRMPQVDYQLSQPPAIMTREVEAYVLHLNGYYLQAACIMCCHCQLHTTQEKITTRIQQLLVSHASLSVLFEARCEWRTEQLSWKTLSQSFPGSAIV